MPGIELVYDEGGDTEFVNLDGCQFLVGRGEACRVRIKSARVSRKHFALALIGQRWLAQDLDSRNGLFLNGKRIKDGVVRAGDRIRLGHEGPELRIARLDPDVHAAEEKLDSTPVL